MSFDFIYYKTHRFEIQRRLGDNTEPSIGHDVTFKTTTETTMVDAKQGVENGSKSGSVFVAGQQLSGRGRRGRSFVSAPGAGLWSTFYFIVEDSQQASLVSLTAALAISDSFVELFGVSVDIKWPNDIQIDGKKISGILPDLTLRDSVFEMYLGIGINIKTPSDLPADVSAIATSIEKLGLDIPSRELLLANLSFFLEKRLSQARAKPVKLIEDWKSQLVTLGKRIRLATPGGDVTGLATDVNNFGELILELDDGSIGTYAAGDVHTLRVAD